MPGNNELRPGRSRARRRASAAGAPLPHESARSHVTGEAVYIDDIPPARGELLVDFVGSPIAHGRICSIDIQAAARVEGVAVVLVHGDIPGERTFGPIFADEEVLAGDECHHVGQPIVLIAAETRAALRAAKEAVRIVMEPLPAVLTIDEAIEGGHFLGHTPPPPVWGSGVFCRRRMVVFCSLKKARARARVARARARQQRRRRRRRQGGGRRGEEQESGGRKQKKGGR